MAYATILGLWIDGTPVDGLPASTAVQLDWPRGMDGGIDLQLLDEQGWPVDLALTGSDSIELSVRVGEEGDRLFSVFGSKRSDNAPGWYTFAIASANTADLRGRQIFDVWATRAGAQRQVVGPGYFNVQARMRMP